jgi:hypothetical protein
VSVKLRSESFSSPSISAAPIKRTAVERQVNLQIVFLFILLLALSAGSTVGASIRSVCLPKLVHANRY